MPIADKHKKAIVSNLQKGDLIVLGQNWRIVRAVTNDNIRHGKAEGQLKFYFAKIRRSGYPGCWTCYERAIVEEKFVGLVKRNVNLGITETAKKVQRSIEVYVETHDSDRARSIITEDESVGKVA